MNVILVDGCGFALHSFRTCTSVVRSDVSRISEHGSAPRRCLPAAVVSQSTVHGVQTWLRSVKYPTTATRSATPGTHRVCSLLWTFPGALWRFPSKYTSLFIWYVSSGDLQIVFLHTHTAAKFS